ncbi:hypothetical protein DYB36_007527 [Aphanomyces astaci]|uniref:Transmembrane protein 135 N-terminal domain-containing protein n=1 Tax=Aphanomyces astaci TaxID=112090 RepID=A0A397AD60_APHAT|nr:hypothetical protein DYB36_007527 [Aphanomyces astaci]
MGSMAFFRLCSYNHKHIVLSYSAVEAISTYYLTHFTHQYWLEHATGVLVTSRLMYTFLFHSDWLLPSQLRMLDFQSGLSPARRASLRGNLHDASVTRCAMLHPHTSSYGAFAMQSAGRLALRSVQIFVPLHLLSMLASLAGAKKQQRRPSLSKVASGLLRSVMILTTNYLFPYMLSCQLPQTHHKVMLGMAKLAPSLETFSRTVISSVRSRRLKPPPSVFVALGVGCGFFRYINWWRSKGDGKSKLAAWVASLVLFQLCSHQHKHVLLSYACVETIVQLYATSSLVQSTLAPTFRWLVEQCASMWSRPDSKLLQHSTHIFVPLHGLSLCLSVGMNRPVSLRRTATSLARSLAFMTSSYMLAYSTSCLLPPHNDLAMIRLTSLTPFLAQYLEPPPRRASIVKAVACYSLLSVYFQLSAKYLVVSKRTGTRLAAALFATCMTYLLQHPERHSRWAMEYLYGPKLSTKSKDNDVDADMA